MGDHRADIKIGFWFHGKTYKYDGWINWCPDSEGYWCIDERVVQFFRESYHDGMARYNEQVNESQKEAREAETKRSELAQLAALKAKYEGKD